MKGFVYNSQYLEWNLVTDRQYFPFLASILFLQACLDYNWAVMCYVLVTIKFVRPMGGNTEEVHAH